MLDIQHLSFAVTNEAAGKEILHDITLTVDSGRFVVITGPNGGGKSTLAKMIAGIEKPTAGKILLDGTDMTDLSITDRAKLGVSYAFQQPVRFKGITVLDLLRIASGKRLSVSEACAILCAAILFRHKGPQQPELFIDEEEEDNRSYPEDEEVITNPDQEKKE